MSNKSLTKIEQWGKIKENSLNAKDKTRRNEIKKEYAKCSKAIKRNIRKDKQRYIEQLVNNAQATADIPQLTGNKNIKIFTLKMGMDKTYLMSMNNWNKGENILKK